MGTTNLTVADLAHAAVSTTTTTTTLREAAAELAGEHRGILLVTGTKGMVGVVSERDVTRAVGEGENPDELRVEDVMSEQVVTIDAAATLLEALELMDANEIRHLVVTKGTTPTGVLSLRDVARTLLGAPTAA